MNKKISLGAAIAFILIIATATFAMTMIYASSEFDRKVVALTERQDQFAKFSEIDRQVRRNYSGSIDEAALMDQVARGYIAGLGDPYAFYFDAKTYEKMLRDAEGSLVGIGAQVEANEAGDGYLLVQKIYPDSPAQAHGLEPGDKIVKLDGEDITPENSLAMLEALSGETGTQVSVVVRRGAEELPPIEMTRRAVVIPTVHTSMISGTNIGYIWIEEFNEYTNDHFNRELPRLTSAGAEGLVIDLRDSKGTSWRSVTRILDRFLPRGEYLASYTTRDGAVETFIAESEGLTIPITLLVNAGTEGAPELFAQVMKDYGRARIVGNTTQGKGVVQQIIKLTDGSAIRITVAELLGPAGDTFNGIGVKPDYDVSTAPDEDWRELDAEHDAQLTKALEVVQGQVRLEGGEDVSLPEPDPIPDEEEPSEEPSPEADDEENTEDGDENAENSESLEDSDLETDEEGGGEDTPEEQEE